MRIPRDNLVRAVFPGVELRETAAEGGLRTMTGHFAVFDQWTEINSVFEGRFLERISPGAFQKTFQEGKAGIRSLFQHGQDPHIGNKPLGPIQRLEEDATGAYYEVGLLDTSYNRDLLPGLEAGLYGASFRFSVTREDVNSKARKSAMNPDAIPERTIREAQVMEFGPVTFPAYKGATAGVRSMTDAFTLKAFTDDPAALRTLLDYNEGTDPHASISVPADIPDEPDVPEATPLEVARARIAELETLLGFDDTAEDLDALDEEERGNYSADQRKEMAKKGHAMPDGSYPIGDAEDVKSAAGLVGHSKKYSADQVKAHVIKNARRLGATGALPDSWNVSSASADEDADSIVRSDPVESEVNAPPDGAEAEPHPIRGRRDKNKSYLRKEKPSWQL